MTADDAPGDADVEVNIPLTSSPTGDDEELAACQSVHRALLEASEDWPDAYVNGDIIGEGAYTILCGGTDPHVVLRRVAEALPSGQWPPGSRAVALDASENEFAAVELA